ncbi:MAG: hypothetical protein ACLPKB_14485 [Xanthobacteraceae bacterium]
MYTLGTAATAAGLSKSTIHRAIKAGRISATKNDTGDWSIDPAELHRVFPPVTDEPVPLERDATPKLEAVVAKLEGEITALKGVSDLLRSQLHDVRTDRDAWREQAARLALPAPEVEPKRPWWKRLAG